MTRDPRRLAAIVSADIAGYSRLMERDESRTLARLKALRHEVIDPKVAEYGGRTVKSMGDGLLLEFPSVVEALRCAVDVQREMALRNSAVGADERIDFRIGINVGDVISDGADIYGDGVNVAARLQGLAEPGSVCVSRGVRDQVLDKLSFRFEDLGAKQVKNIARPVEAFRVLDERGEAAPAGAARVRAAGAPRPAANRSFRWIAAGLAGLAVAGAVAWGVTRFWPQSRSEVSTARSIVVLPFAAASRETVDVEFAETLTRDVTGALARSEPDRTVIAHGTAAAYKGKAGDARAIGRELTARYLAEGEVRRDGGRLAVDVRLVDTAGARQVWQQRFELEPGVGGEEGRSLLERRIALGLRVALGGADGRAATAAPLKDADAAALVARANAVPGTDPKSNEAATRLYEEALRIDPNYGPALAGLAFHMVVLCEADVRADCGALRERMDELTKKAVEAGDSDPFAWLVRGIALGWQGRVRPALEAYDRAHRLDPSRRGPYGWRAFTLATHGRTDEALAVLAEARRTFGDPYAFELRVGGFASLLAGRYDDAIAQAESAAGQGVWYFDYVVLAAAYADKGDLERAAAAARELQKILPGFSIEVWKGRKHSTDPVYVEQAEKHLYPGLRKAGVPER